MSFTILFIMASFQGGSPEMPSDPPRERIMRESAPTDESIVPQPYGSTKPVDPDIHLAKPVIESRGKNHFQHSFVETEEHRIQAIVATTCVVLEAEWYLGRGIVVSYGMEFGIAEGFRPRFPLRLRYHLLEWHGADFQFDLLHAKWSYKTWQMW